jgi:hypothetical protein
MAHLRDYYQCFLAIPALVKELKTFNLAIPALLKELKTFNENAAREEKKKALEKLKKKYSYDSWLFDRLKEKGLEGLIKDSFWWVSGVGPKVYEAIGCKKYDEAYELYERELGERAAA